MAYAKRTSSTLPELADGEFYKSGPDTEGKVLVGFGRATRSKFIEFRQPELLALLEHAHEIVRNDDLLIGGLLSDLAQRIRANRGTDLTIADLKAGAQDPAMGPVLERFCAFMLQGLTQTEALRKLNEERTQQKLIAQLDADTARTHP